MIDIEFTNCTKNDSRLKNDSRFDIRDSRLKNEAFPISNLESRILHRPELDRGQLLPRSPFGNTQEFDTHFAVIRIEIEDYSWPYLFRIQRPCFRPDGNRGRRPLCQSLFACFLLKLRSKNAVTRRGDKSETFTTTGNQRFPFSGMHLMKCRIPSS